MAGVIKWRINGESAESKGRVGGSGIGAEKRGAVASREEENSA